MLPLTYQCGCHETAAPHQPQNNPIYVHTFLSFQSLQQGIQGNQHAHLGHSTRTEKEGRKKEVGRLVLSLLSIQPSHVGMLTVGPTSMLTSPKGIFANGELQMVGSGILPTVKDPGTGPLPMWYMLPNTGQEAYQDFRVGQFLSLPQWEQELLQQSLLGLLFLARQRQAGLSSKFVGKMCKVRAVLKSALKSIHAFTLTKRSPVKNTVKTVHTKQFLAYNLFQTCREMDFLWLYAAVIFFNPLSSNAPHA